MLEMEINFKGFLWWLSLNLLKTVFGADIDGNHGMAIIALYRHRLMAVPPLGAHANLGGVGEAPGARAETGYHGLPMQRASD